MTAKRILVLGGAHIDRRGRTEGAAIMGASNPGSWFEEAGGGGFNAAQNLSRLGHSVTLVSPRGGDLEGDKVSAAALAAGIADLPFTFLDRRTPSYTAILDAEGNLVIALADMELYGLFHPRRLKTRELRDAFDAADIVLTDANLPEETLAALAECCAERGLPLFGIAISPAKVVRFKPMLARLDWLFMNEAEAAALTGAYPDHARDWPALLAAEGLKAGVVTRGRLGAVAYDGQTSALLAPLPVETIGDVTGAGDALASGFLDGLTQALTVHECLRRGTALAGLTLVSKFATIGELTRQMLDDAVGLVPEAQNLA
jgi:sugar/nucleoside kinase (ribokinase family)